MSRRQHACWLDVGTGKDGAFIIRDLGSLAHVVGELTQPDGQYPVLSLFLGGRQKNEALRSLFPQNNIKRSQSDACVSLRCDVSSSASTAPLLFADSDPLRTPGPWRESMAQQGTVHPILWSASSANEVLRFIYARLLFLFADVVCIFANDTSSGSCIRITKPAWKKRLVPRQLRQNSKRHVDSSISRTGETQG
ncbi:hypothetical protein VTN96DRAFT_6394 [Rasamsonia emersonii]